MPWVSEATLSTDKAHDGKIKRFMSLKLVFNMGEQAFSRDAIKDLTSTVSKAFGFIDETIGVPVPPIERTELDTEEIVVVEKEQEPRPATKAQQGYILGIYRREDDSREIIITEMKRIGLLDKRRKKFEDDAIKEAIAELSFNQAQFILDALGK